MSGGSVVDCGLGMLIVLAFKEAGMKVVGVCMRIVEVEMECSRVHCETEGIKFGGDGELHGFVNEWMV